jgi:hypothetical protein
MTAPESEAMTNTYKPTSAYGRAIFGDDVFDGDFDAAEEKDHLDGGHLEIVPRKYEVLSDNFSGGRKGSEYTAALVKDVEAALLAGYHLRRADAAAKVAKKAAAS